MAPLRLVPRPDAAADAGQRSKTPELTSRQELLVKAGQPMVEKCAVQVAGQYHPLVTPAELRGPGTVALYEAALAYQTELHPNFSWYAYSHVWGRMQDAVRADHFSRGARVERAMERDFARFASHQVLEGDLFNDSDEEVHESARRSGDDALASALLAGLLEAHHASAEDEVLAREDQDATLTALREAVGTLLPHERQVIEMVYYRQMTLDEVGRALSTSVRTAQRRHKEALRKLRKFLLKEGAVTSRWPSFDHFL